MVLWREGRVRPLNPGPGLMWASAVFEWQSTYTQAQTPKSLHGLWGANIVQFVSLTPEKNITYCSEQRCPLSLRFSHNYRLHEKESLIIGWGGRK